MNIFNSLPSFVVFLYSFSRAHGFPRLRFPLGEAFFLSPFFSSFPHQSRAVEYPDGKETGAKNRKKKVLDFVYMKFHHVPYSFSLT